MGSIKLSIIMGTLVLSFVGGVAAYIGYLNATIADITVERDAARTEALVESERREFAETQIRAAKKRIAGLQKDMAKHEGQVAELRALFGNHDFTKLVNAKPKLIEKRMQAATKQVFKELKNATSD